jgi:hypothetical protein
LSVSAASPCASKSAAAFSRAEAAAALDGVTLLRALGGKADPPAALADAESRVGALLGELTLTVVEGDRQLAGEGKPLPQPIMFSAWLKGKKAVGLPVAVTVPGGRAAGVAVGPDGRGEVRVEDAGRFGKEQSVSIAVDWPGLLGAAQVPAWIAALPKASVTAVALRKGVETTRVLVLAADRGLSSALTAALRKAGFAVQDGQALLDKFGAERIAAMTDAQLREASRRVAEVVVMGGVGADVHALEVASGQVLFRAPAGKGVSAALQAALVKAASEP